MSRRPDRTRSGTILGRTSSDSAVSWLLDTNVVCESTCKQPDSRVSGWLQRHHREGFFVSAITPAEILKGIIKLDDTPRKRALDSWYRREFLPGFRDSILPLDELVLERWAGLVATSERAGHSLPSIDSLIAATALAHNLTLVTRNTVDFEATGVPCLNPWSAG